MQHRSFRIDDILGEDAPKESTKPERKEEPQMTVVRRPILLPRIEPIVWGHCANNCCNTSPNCGRTRETKTYQPPWYYSRNPHGFQGKNVIVIPKTLSRYWPLGVVFRVIYLLLKIAEQIHRGSSEF